MGQLTFSELEFTVLGPDSILVFGHWRLQREADHPGGLFTLVFRRMGNDWRIVHDHTSAEDTH
jgi:ketosteroid isomerase-like protein